jgi:hypothetical protein
VTPLNYQICGPKKSKAENPPIAIAIYPALSMTSSSSCICIIYIYIYMMYDVFIDL